MDLSNKGVFAGFILLFAIGISLLGFLVYYVVNKRSKSNTAANGQVMISITTPITSSQYTLKPFLTKSQDNSAWSYSAIMKLGKFQSESNNVILLARGNKSDYIVNQDMLVLMDNDSSSMYVAFRNLVPVASSESSTNYFTPVAFRSQSDTSSIINKSFCLFKVPDVPFFRYFALHIIYDYNNGVARVYIDGNIVSVCPFFECNNVGLATQNGDSVSVGYQLPSNYTVAGDSMMNLTAWSNVEYRYLKVMNSVIDPSAIASESSDMVSSVYDQVQQEVKSQDQCNL